MRDAAVTVAAGDFLAPTGAGTATPEGPLSISPGVHASIRVVSGAVSSTKATQQSAENAGLRGVFPQVFVPVLATALPSAALEDAEVVIVGSGFIGVTGVKFGAVAVAEYTVDSPTQITAVMPAGSAGSAPVTVTNAAGVSAALAYTRGA